MRGKVNCSIPQFCLALLSRWVHILSGCYLIGAISYIAIFQAPTDSTAGVLLFRKTTHAVLTFTLLSGLYNIYTLWTKANAIYPKSARSVYMGCLHLKVLVTLVSFMMVNHGIINGLSAVLLSFLVILGGIMRNIRETFHE